MSKNGTPLYLATILKDGKMQDQKMRRTADPIKDEVALRQYLDRMGWEYDEISYREVASQIEGRGRQWWCELSSPIGSAK